MFSYEKAIKIQSREINEKRFRIRNPAKKEEGKKRVRERRKVYSYFKKCYHLINSTKEKDTHCMQVIVGYRSSLYDSRTPRRKINYILDRIIPKQELSDLDFCFFQKIDHLYGLGRYYNTRVYTQCMSQLERKRRWKGGKNKAE